MLTSVLMLSLLHQTATTWEWVDRQGVTHFTDDRSTIPAGASAKQTSGGELGTIPGSTKTTTPFKVQRPDPAQPSPSRSLPAGAWVAIAMALLAHLWLLVLAFSKSVFWGIGVLVLPVVGVFFIISQWRAAKWPFMLSVLSGLALMAALAHA